MYIKEEDKALGKENFYRGMTIDPKDHRGMSRRDFLIGTLGAAAAGGVGLGAMYFGYGQSVENPVRVGFIGTGDEGSVLIGAHTPSYVQCVAIADIRPYNIHRAFHGDYASDNTLAVRAGLMNIYGWKTQKEAEEHVNVSPRLQRLARRPQRRGRYHRSALASCTPRQPSAPCERASTCSPRS